MTICYIAPIGHDLPTGQILPDVRFLPLTPEVPPFDIDAVMVFDGAGAGDRYVLELRRSGRPFTRMGTVTAEQLPGVLEAYRDSLAGVPRTNYQPVDCNFYDNFEAAIVQRRKIALTYVEAEGEKVTIITGLNDLKTHRTEEYVQLADEKWLRLDRVVAVDGVEAEDSCRF